MKTIVVFGASGDLGNGFVRYFAEKHPGGDFRLVATGRRRDVAFPYANVEYIPVDIQQPSHFARLPQDIWAVVDMAGYMPARMEGYDPQGYIDVNITGTLNILKYCLRAGADRILYGHSFGDIKDHAEQDPLLKVDLPRSFSFTNDHSVYVMTKNFAVDLIEHYHQVYGLKRFIIRMPTIYLLSPTDHFYVDGVLRKIAYRELIDKARAGEPIEVWGDPSRVKDMVYIKDLCQMLEKALFVDRSEGFYNAGTGVGTSLLEQIQGMVQVFSPQEHPSQLIFRPDKPNAPQYIMDIEPARQELGYVPAYDYISMLQDMKKEMDQWNAQTKK